MITAVDARRLQAEGVSQDEYLQKALLRCNDAIADVARNRRDKSVCISVLRLTEDSLRLLSEDLRERGFIVKEDFRDFERSAITVGWAE